jgi:hypothetical protein
LDVDASPVLGGSGEALSHKAQGDVPLRGFPALPDCCAIETAQTL